MLTPAPSIAAMVLGKLMVVTRLVLTGTAYTTCSSRSALWMALLSVASGEPAATNMNKKLLSDFIFEVGDGRRKTSVGRHVWVANEAEP